MPIFQRIGDEAREEKLKKENLEQLVKDKFNPKQEEKKTFSWDDFFNNYKENGGYNPLNPFANRFKVYEKLWGIEKQEPKEGTITELFKDYEKAVDAGQVRGVYGLSRFLLSGIDYGFDSNFVTKIDNLYEKYRPEQPETISGELVSLISEYALPGGIASKIVGRANKILKPFFKPLTKYISKNKATSIASRVGYGASVVGATDFIAYNPDSIVPWNKNKFIDTENLTGREKVIADFKNRLLYGVEGAIIGGGFPLVGAALKPVAKGGAFVAGLGLKAGDKAVVKPITYLLAKDPILLPTVAKIVQKVPQATLNALFTPAINSLSFQKPFTKLPPFEKWRMFSVFSGNAIERNLKRVDNFLAPFRSMGKLTPGLGKLQEDAGNLIKGRARRIDKYLESIEKQAYTLAREFQKTYDGKTSSMGQQEYYLDAVLSYLKGEFSPLPNELLNSAKGLKKLLDNVKKEFGDILPEGELKQAITSTFDKYMKQSFSMFTSNYYNPERLKPKLFEEATKWVEENVVKKNKDMLEAAAGNTESYAKNLIKSVLQNGKVDAKDPLDILNYISKNLLRSDEFIKTGEELPDVIRRLLGQENNLKGSVLTTVSSMITDTARKKMYDSMVEIGLKEGWLFKDSAEAIGKGVSRTQKIGRIHGLKNVTSTLSDYYAAPDIAQAINKSSGKLDSLMQNGFYAFMMQLKTGVQFGKTVLSPATQVRNVGSASFFPLMNGHIGGNASVTNSLKMVMDDIFGAGKIVNENDFIENIGRKIDLGVLDENIVTSELKAVLEDIKKDVLVNSNRLLNVITNAKWLKVPTRIYAGGDNLWKWYGHEYMKSQLKNVFKNFDEVAQWYKQVAGEEIGNISKINPGQPKLLEEAIEETAAWYIKNTYPTYSKVPPVIQSLRKLPFGNFISFPAEMMRTTTNILNLAGKEITSNNAAIRQMGYRRLIGATTVLGGAGAAMTEIALNLTGITKEMIDNYKRDYGASWEKEAQIYPITKPEKGKFNFINFSYFSPYDVVTAPVRSLMRLFKERQTTPDELKNNIVGEMLKGPVWQLISPFVAEAIGLERLTDVLPAGVLMGGRGGVTKTGSKVYSDSDDAGDVIVKSLIHLVKGIEPGGTKTFRRIGQGFTGSKDVDPYKELLNLFSGIRVNEADISKTLNYVLTDFNRIQKDVFETENFYTADDWNTRGPEEIAKDFEQIQNEAYKEQVKIYQAIETAKKFGLSDGDILKIMKDRKISTKKAVNLLAGIFSPVSYSKGLFEKKIKDLQDREKRRGLDIFTPERDYLYYYPIDKLLEVKNSFFGKRLEAEKPPEEKATSGGPTPVTVTPDLTTSQVTEPQTPPLPATPSPVVAQASPTGGITNTNVVNPLNGLTRTQTALLSPSEQAIAQKSNRRIV